MKTRMMARNARIRRVRSSSRCEISVPSSRGSFSPVMVPDLRMVYGQLLLPLRRRSWLGLQHWLGRWRRCGRCRRRWRRRGRWRRGGRRWHHEIGRQRYLEVALDPFAFGFKLVAELARHGACAPGPAPDRARELRELVRAQHHEGEAKDHQDLREADVEHARLAKRSSAAPVVLARGFDTPGRLVEL